jgi:putative monooxygenase
MEHVRVVNPFRDAKQIWLGLQEEGLRRKVFRIIDKELVHSENLVAGLTIFEPGERCAPHNHPESEEINIAIRGGGIAYDKTAKVETRFKQGDWIFIPKGHVHVHYNDGEEPLWLMWCYAPPGELPKR